MLAKTKPTFTAWFVCTLGAIFYAYEYLLRITPSAMEFSLRSHFDLSATGFGALSSVYYYAYVPMQLPVGILMDRFGPRRLLTLACIICVIGSWLFCNTNDVTIAIAGRFLIGAGSAFAFVGVLKLATIWLPENKLAMISGMTSALGTIGAMIGDNVLGTMIHKFGWQTTINHTAIFGLVLIIFLWMFIHDHKRDHESGGTIDTFRKNLIDLGIILREKQIWLNGFFGCLIYLPTTVFAELWGIPYLMHAHHLSQSEAGFANSLLFCGFMVGAPFMGWVSDKIKRRKPPMIIGAAGAVCIMLAILYWPGIGPSAVKYLMFILGLFYSAQSIVFAVGRELSPSEAAGTAIAITNMIVMLGAVVLQPLIGKILDWSLIFHTHIATKHHAIHQIQQTYSTIDYQLAMLVIPIGIIVALVLTIFIRETHAHG